MEQAPLLAWESFYVIVGSAAAVLIGLQFVVVALAAEINIVGDPTATRVFATPTIIHFSAVLFIAAFLNAPWPALQDADLALGATGLVGATYVVLVMRHARDTTSYLPVLEDWIWHCILPFIAYVVLVAASILLQGRPLLSMFMVGAVALMLLFIGIHNAWDSATYLALKRRQSFVALEAAMEAEAAPEPAAPMPIAKPDSSGG